MADFGFARRAAPFLIVLSALLVGCDDGDTTIIQGGGGQLLVGNYPASQLIDHLVGSDGRAFNHSGAKINKGLNVFWDGASGNAIVMYVDEYERLWAHYFNGADITPGVQLHGPNQYDLTQRDARDTDDEWEYFEQFRVLFINASGRQGDAIILWSGQDRDESDITPNADENDRLWGTYFDASAASTPMSGTVQYGFQTLGQNIDFDNVSPNTDDDLETFGFVSDSLAQSHAFDARDENSYEWPNRFDNGSDNGLPPATRSGEPTTCVFIVWTKAQEDGTNTTTRRFHWLEFDLNQTGNALPTQTSNAQNTIDPGLDPNNSVDGEFVVHNKCLIWGGRDQGTGLDGLFLTCFSAGQQPTTIELSTGIADTAAQVGDGTQWVNTNTPDVPLAQNVYGGDHGLDSLYVFFRTTGNGPVRLACSKVPLNDLGSQSAREIEQIDAANGNSVVDFDTEKDNFYVTTLINRSSDFIFAAFLQSSLLAPAQLQGPVQGVSEAIWVHGVQVDDGNRTLPLSLANGGPFATPNQGSSPNSPNGRLFLQYEVADGLSDPLCGIQSNRFRINYAWHEDIGTFLLKHNGLVLSPATGSTNQPTAAFALQSGGLVATGDTGYPFDEDNGMSPIVLDLGTAAGDPLIYFLNNANNPADDTATGAFDELRVFGYAAADGTTTQLISTNGNADDATISEDMIDGRDGELDELYERGGMFFRAKTTPTSRSAGNHGGSTVHLFWQETRFGPQSHPALKTRYFTKSAFDTGAVTTSFSSAHMPALTAAPIGLDGFDDPETHVPPTVHPDGDEVGPFVAFCTASGSTVGIYYQTDTHFWYQEFTGSWLNAPEIIDNAVPGNLFGGRDQRAYAFPPRLNNTCDNFNGVLTFHSKTLSGDDQGRRRWFMRVHD